MTRTRVAAPAPRPSDEEMLDAIGRLTLREVLRLRLGLHLLLIRRLAKQAGL